MTIIFFIGRLILGAFFLFNGYNHFKNHKNLAIYAEIKKVTRPSLMVYLSGFCMIFGGLTIIVNRFTVLGLMALVLFLIPTTFIMHKFWKEIDVNSKKSEFIAFTKNMAIIGALLMIISIG